jgi:DNA (cytosine-5)-methyltransferase 1
VRSRPTARGPRPKDLCLGRRLRYRIRPGSRQNDDRTEPCPGPLVRTGRTDSVQRRLHERPDVVLSLWQRLSIEVGQRRDQSPSPAVSSSDSWSGLSAEYSGDPGPLPVWDQRRYDMVAGIRSGSGGSAWANAICTACGKTTADADAMNCFACGEILPRPLVREADGSIRFITGFRRSSYARMYPGRPAATITTASGRIGSDRTIHPWQTRVLSPLECQFLQTFPAGFKWGDTLARFGHTHIRAMIGEAVPPHFTAQHGRVLSSLLSGRRPYRFMSSSDSRVEKGERMLSSARGGTAVVNLD